MRKGGFPCYLSWLEFTELLRFVGWYNSLGLEKFWPSSFQRFLLPHLFSISGTLIKHVSLKLSPNLRPFILFLPSLFQFRSCHFYWIVFKFIDSFLCCVLSTSLNEFVSDVFFISNISIWFFFMASFLLKSPIYSHMFSTFSTISFIIFIIVILNLIILTPGPFLDCIFFFYLFLNCTTYYVAIFCYFFVI